MVAATEVQNTHRKRAGNETKEVEEQQAGSGMKKTVKNKHREGRISLSALSTMTGSPSGHRASPRLPHAWPEHNLPF